jgi:hypothetical protein
MFALNPMSKKLSVQSASWKPGLLAAELEVEGLFINCIFSWGPSFYMQGYNVSWRMNGPRVRRTASLLIRQLHGPTQLVKARVGTVSAWKQIA